MLAYRGNSGVCLTNPLSNFAVYFAWEKREAVVLQSIAFRRAHYAAG